MGFRTFTTEGKVLWYYSSLVRGSPTQWVWGLVSLMVPLRSHCLAVASSSLDVGYLFFLVSSSVLLLMVVQQLVAVLVLLQEEMSRILLLLHLEPEALDMLPFSCRSLLGCDSERPSPLSV